MTIKKQGYDYVIEPVTVKGRQYNPNFIIDLRTLKDSEKDQIDYDNCICVFSILNRDNPVFRQYVAVEHFEKLDFDTIMKEFNGYLPETAFCFTSSYFPIEEFREEQDFKHFLQQTKQEQDSE